MKKDERTNAQVQDQEQDQFQAPKPKKPVNTFSAYIRKNIKIVVHEHKLEYKDGIKKCAEIWKTLGEDEQKQYKEIAAQDVLRYERELKEYKETGFFTNENGINSKDMPKKRCTTHA